MRILSSGLVLLLFSVWAAAQTSSTAPDVTVLQSKWRIDIYNPALDKDPLSPSKQHLQEEIRQRAAAQASENKVRQQSTAAPAVRSSRGETVNSRLFVTYFYHAKVKNIGEKEIKVLVWEYIFFEPGTTKELGRRRFVTRKTIKPGDTRELIARSRKSPTESFDVTKAGKKPRDQFSEQIVIRNLAYADGSKWPVTTN